MGATPGAEGSTTEQDGEQKSMAFSQFSMGSARDIVDGIPEDRRVVLLGGTCADVSQLTSSQLLLLTLSLTLRLCHTLSLTLCHTVCLLLLCHTACPSH
jgi:hypothetical protein